MHSKQLKQALRLSLDTMGMRGPITKRQVCEPVVRSPHWSVADDFEARLAYLMNEAGSMMDEVLTQQYIDANLKVPVPEKLRHTLAGCRSFICISKRGGRGAEHVLTINATHQNWEAYIDLKKYVENTVRQKRLADQDILDLLRMLGAATIKDLFK